ncbi:MAG: hypothetical protein V5A55_08990 [Halovenus sp.]
MRPIPHQTDPENEESKAVDTLDAGRNRSAEDELWIEVQEF